MTLTTTIRKANDPQFDADTITATLANGAEIRVYVFASDVGDIPIVQIDTEPTVGQMRVTINDGDAWVGDPEKTVPDWAYMDVIAAELNGKEWTPDTLDAIADVVRRSGRTINDVDVDA